MRNPPHLDLQTVLLDRADVHAFRELAHQLIQQMHRQIAVGLQGLHSLLPLAQRIDFPFQARNFLDLLVQHGNLRAQVGVAILLVFNPRLEPPIDQGRHQQTHDHGQEHGDLKRLFAALARSLSVGQ